MFQLSESVNIIHIDASFTNKDFPATDFMLFSAEGSSNNDIKSRRVFIECRRRGGKPRDIQHSRQTVRWCGEDSLS